MAMHSHGRRALALALFGAVAPAQATRYPHSIVVDAGEAFSLERGDSIAIDGPGAGRAVEVRKRASFDAYDVDILNHSAGNGTRHAYGLLAFGEASALIADSRITSSGPRSIGVHAQDASRVTLQNVALGMNAGDSIGISSRSGSRVTANGVTLRMQGDKSIGVYAAGVNTRVVGSGLSIVHAGKRSGPGATFDVAEAVAVRGGANVELSKSSLLATEPGVDTVTIQGIESTFTAVDTRIVAEGADASAIALAGGVAAIDGGEVRGAGHAIHAVGGNKEFVMVLVRGGAHIVGRIGNTDQALTFNAHDSYVQGDIVSSGSGALSVGLDNSSWRGRAERVAELVVADSAWGVTGDSSVHRLTLLGRSRVAFDDSAPPGSLRVGTFANPGGEGSVTLRARLDGGGALDHQLTDRLLVSGDVAGSTPLHVVNAGGAGADTSPLTQEPRAGDGISVVQVGGSAAADAFQLAGGYVAVGPWQYGLVAYAPGTSDPEQRLLQGAGNDHWDFRLQSNRTDASGRPVNDHVSHAAPARARLLPQVPAYLVLANALFGYGTASMEASRPIDPAASRGSAWRARTFGGHAQYRSDLPFQRYAVDYTRSDRGLQVAGDLLAWSAGATTMRAGLELSAGSTHVVPRAVDGISRARADARSIAATYVLDTESGWRADASYGFTHYRIDVSTPFRGEVLGRLRANANEATLAGGFRWSPALGLTIEPSGSLLWQRLRFLSAQDRDGLLVRPGAPERLTVRGGARASMQFEPRGDVLVAWSPYLDTRYVVTRESGRSIDVSGVRLATGNAGRAAEIAAGVSMQFSANLTASIDMTSRMRLGRAGESGMSARAGIVYTF
jgi:outer membrane autotransporter protein